MLKSILGLIMTIIGSLFFIVVIMVGIIDRNDSIMKVAVAVVFSIPCLFLVWFGVKMMRSANKKIKEKERILNILTENILSQWEISGKEWEAYKEKKCSPEAINRFTLMVSLFTSITLGVFFALITIDAEQDVQLIISSVAAFIIFIFSYIAFKKKRNNLYGNLYSLKSCEVILSNTHISFNGKILQIKGTYKRVTAAKIVFEKDFNTLMINVRSYGTINRGYTYYELPLPSEKIDEVKSILDKLKVW